jgi:hypothetical protein
MSKLFLSPPGKSSASAVTGGRTRFAKASITAVLLGMLVALQACDGDSGGGGNATAPVSFGVSDTPVMGLTSVVITIDRIILSRDGRPDVVIDEFTSERPDGIKTDTITIDLLDYRGEDNLLIAGPVELNVADYQNLRLEIIDEDMDLTYVVEELGGTKKKQLKVPSGELKLGRFEVKNSGDQTFILEFGLRKAMTYNPGPDRYILKPRGVRIVEVERGTTIGGAVNTDFFAGAAPCDGKIDPGDPLSAFVGNVMYIYQGIGLDPADFADNFDPDLDQDAAPNSLEPYAAETVEESGTYLFSYLSAGDYTLAFSCDAADDYPIVDDGIPIPSPEDVFIEVTTRPGEDWACDFGLPDDFCELIEP